MPILEPHRIAVTLVHSPACHFCDDASVALAELATTQPIDVTTVGLESDEGAALVARHRPAMNPLVLVDGEFFSSGRLPRKKLLRLLSRRADAAAAYQAGVS
ncbi:glutaredoxin family protein [Demequina sp. TTPB684]|uniref:glutaredoxin family protein n=1 Tax=unclassified Demequina TaxID=2620311 RepID=UPI001CF4A2B6|nr:glutaredoxin family protein [Demequina sp. TMPB413]MCB2412691.1 glutaredoxin family protein [Demequina sp. TTPB684]UPU87669.1 glutaredoxin family protein [Demequina sp. TMPB413]